MVLEKLLNTSLQDEFEKWWQMQSRNILLFIFTFNSFIVALFVPSTHIYVHDAHFCGVPFSSFNGNNYKHYGDDSYLRVVKYPKPWRCCKNWEVENIFNRLTR